MSTRTDTTHDDTATTSPRTDATTDDLTTDATPTSDTAGSRNDTRPTSDTLTPDSNTSWTERCKRQFTTTSTTRVRNLADDENQAMHDGV